jgi:tetratricopeptide (TPR) repeat protein/DNA-binding XRE family transcriptional regulator
MENHYLIQARTLRFWSPEEASKQVGVGKKTYERWENGECIPYLKTLGMLCEAFDVQDPEQLGYIIDGKRIRLKRPGEDILSTENAPEQSTDDLAQAHEEMLESIRRSLQTLAGKASNKQEASELDKLMSTIVTILVPSLNMELVGVGLWLCDRVDKLKRVGTCERITSQKYQIIMYLEVESWKSVIDDDYQTTEAYHWTRRMALENLLLLPASLLTVVQWPSHSNSAAKEFLIQCAPCIMACSYLLNGDGLVAVEQMLPPYLRQLTKMAKAPSPLQKEAAYLAAQGHCLIATIKLHQRQFNAQVAHCNKAVELAKVTGNRLLIAATLTRLGVAWFYFGEREKYLETYQEAESLLKEEPALFPARLQICIYMGLSGAHTRLGHKQDAEYYLALANALPISFDDDLFVPALDFDLSEKISWEGSININIGELEEKKGSRTRAELWYKKAAAILAQKVPPSFPERTLLQTINHQGTVAIKLGNKNDFILYTTKGAIRVKLLRSKQRENEIKRNIREGKNLWRYEQDVQKLDELFDSNGDE